MSNEDRLNEVLKMFIIEAFTNTKRPKRNTETLVSLDHRVTEDDLSDVKDKDKVIIKDYEVKITLTYPLRNSYSKKYKSDKGFTIGDIIKCTIEMYKFVYSEEEKTTTTKVTSMDDRIQNGLGLLNRNETNGKFGIWGHDIEDLIIEGIEYDKDEKTVYLSMGS